MHLAMRTTGGTDFVCLDAAFHGRSFATIGLTYVHPGMVEGSNKGLDRYLPRQMRIPNYNCYRCPLGLKRETCDLACAEAIDWALERGHLNGPAGVIVEPYQANGGMVPAPDGYLERAHEIAKSHEVPLIVDEIQGALCRCGPMYASERAGIEPEMIILGKALGGGLPLSATITTPEYSELLPWEYGFTQAGNPMACAAGLAMVEIMVRDDLPANSERIGGLMVDRLAEIEKDSKLIGDIRGQGLMIGVELVRDRETKEPAIEEIDKLMAACLEHGLMIGKTGPVFGSNGNVVKFKPAVNVTEEDAERWSSCSAARFATSRRRFDAAGRSPSSPRSATTTWEAAEVRRVAARRRLRLGRVDAWPTLDSLLDPGLGARLPAGPGHRWRRGGRVTLAGGRRMRPRPASTWSTC